MRAKAGNGFEGCVLDGRGNFGIVMSICDIISAPCDGRHPYSHFAPCVILQFVCFPLEGRRERETKSFFHVHNLPIIKSCPLISELRCTRPPLDRSSIQLFFLNNLRVSTIACCILFVCWVVCRCVLVVDGFPLLSGVSESRFS